MKRLIKILKQLSLQDIRDILEEMTASAICILVMYVILCVVFGIMAVIINIF